MRNRTYGRVVNRDWRHREREVMVGRGTDHLLRNRLLLWAWLGDRRLQRRVWETEGYVGTIIEILVGFWVYNP